MGVYVVNQVLVRGGWKGLLCLRDSIIDSDFAGLKHDCPSMYFGKISV